MNITTRKNILLFVGLVMVVLLIIGLTLMPTQDNKVFASTSKRYLLNGSVNYVANLPYGAGYNKTVTYNDFSTFRDYFAVYMYSNDYSGSGTLYQNEIINFSYVTIVAEVLQSKSPHNQNYPFAHQSYELKNSSGSVVASGTLSGTGSKTLIARTLSDGTYTLKYVAGGTKTGIGGGSITDTMTFTFTLDGTAPTCTLRAGGATVNSGSYTNSLVTFTATDARFYKLYYMRNGTTYVTSSTSYAVSATSANNGWWYFYATDSADNRSMTYSIYIDTVAPSGTLSASGTTINSGSYINKAFSYSATDSSGLNYYQYKTPSSSSWATYKGAVISTSSASGWYYFRAVDKAGNISSESKVYLDATKPSGTLYSGTNAVSNNSVVNGQYIKFVAQDSQSGIKNVYVKQPNSASFVTTTSGSQYTEQGTYSFYCIDNAGNVSSTYNITLDSQPPQIFCNGAEFYNATADVFTVSCSEGTLYYKYGSEAWQSTDSLSKTINKSDKEGKYYFYAIDSNNNSTDTYWVELVTTPPSGQLVKSDTDNTVYFTWSNNDWTATLNNKPYTKNTWITTEGDYTIVLKSSVGLSTTYSFSIGHNYVPIETKEATCTENGYTIYECTNCNHTKNEDFVEALGHDYTQNSSFATCTETGKLHYSCNRCDYSYYVDTEPALGHSYTTSVVSSCSCTESGYRYHECDRCGDSYHSEIPPSGHNYELQSEVVEDKVTIRTYKCSLCGENYVQDMGNQYEKVTNYVEYLFAQYYPYMWWVLLATSGIWSIVIGIAIIIARKNDDKVKSKSMLVNYLIGLVVIFAIVVACPYLVQGIAVLVS